MIYVEFNGFAGNQMFQYAMARNIQCITGQKICITTGAWKRYGMPYTINTREFKLSENVIYDDSIKMPVLANRYNVLGKLANRFFPEIYCSLLQNLGIYFWFHRKYIPIKIKKRKNYYITGFWQCEKNFENIRNILLEDFSIRNSVLETENTIIENNKNMYEKIVTTDSVCISIRRGDYVTNPRNKRNFYVCDLQYFYKAIEKMELLHPQATYFVFSDDIEWAKENLTFRGKMAYYESGNDPIWEKLRLMSSCRNFIISNSSFSWWAEYLSKSNEGTTIAPSRWYAAGEPADIYRDHWTLIDV